MTRRNLMTGSLAATCLGAMAPGALMADAPSRERLQECAFGTVRLTGGPFKALYDAMAAHYLALDEDRLLKGFRQHVGLAAPGRSMGGWYDPEGFVPGLTLGQYISGLSRLGAGMKAGEYHAKAARLVAGYGQMLARTDNPYIGPGAQQQWAAYVMDKYLVGMLDAARLSGVAQARALIAPTVDKCLPFISPVSRDRIGKVNPPYDETYVLPENLFLAADLTGERRYGDLARHYMLDPEWFKPLAQGRDVLPGKHAYSHAIALSSGGAAYLATGDATYARALTNAWDFLERQRFASGGWGPEEQFVEPGQGRLAAALTGSKAHFETPCGAFADTKLARYLIRITGHARYAEGLERTLYNTLLASRLPDSDGGYPYYSNYGPMGHKDYYFKQWPCCSGTLVQGVADMVRNIYFRQGLDVWVAMTAPSVLDDGVWELTQETAYPAQSHGRILVNRAPDAGAALHLRIPSWAQGAVVTVNGAPVKAAPGDYLRLARRWRAGDVIGWRFDQPIRLLPIDESAPDRVAIMRGPVMYAALNPWESLWDTRVALPDALRPVPGQDEAFTLDAGGRQATLVPYFAVQNETTNCYFLKG